MRFPKTGNFRAQFLLESVADLRQSLQKLGSDLVICQGRPEAIIQQIAKQLGVTAVYFHEEVTSEELAVEKALSKALKPLGAALKSFWGHTLYHPDNLPFGISNIPEVFTNFRKRVEQSSEVAPTFPTPKRLPPLPEIDTGTLPQLADFGLQPPAPDKRAALQFKGGETAGLERVQQYFWKQDRLRVYKDTRNGMLGADYSSKFSPWLALGCLSPRYIWEEVQKYQEERVKNDSTYWLVFELLWRDSRDKRLKPIDALKIYALKTAPAFEAALFSGARLAGSVDQYAQPIKTFARNLGVAFQILNDLNDWRGDEHNKLTSGGDLLAGRPTVLWALALEGLDDSARSELLALPQEDQRPVQERVRRAWELYQQAGVFDKANRLVDKHQQRCEEIADQIEPEALRRLLHYLIAVVLERPEEPGLVPLVAIADN